MLDKLFVESLPNQWLKLSFPGAPLFCKYLAYLLARKWCIFKLSSKSLVLLYAFFVSFSALSYEKGNIVQERILQPFSQSFVVPWCNGKQSGL